MSIATRALEQVEKRLPKVIDARAHSIIDFCHAGFFLGMAWFLRRREPRASWAALAAGSFLLAEALCTDYPLGVVRQLPFETHGRMDAAFAASSMALPRILRFEGTPAAAIFKGNSLAEAAIVGMTDWNSRRARRA
jgi:hypothetical protein